MGNPETQAQHAAAESRQTGSAGSTIHTADELVAMDIPARDPQAYPTAPVRAPRAPRPHFTFTAEPDDEPAAAPEPDPPAPATASPNQAAAGHVEPVLEAPEPRSRPTAPQRPGHAVRVSFSVEQDSDTPVPSFATPGSQAAASLTDFAAPPAEYHTRVEQARAPGPVRTPLVSTRFDPAAPLPPERSFDESVVAPTSFAGISNQRLSPAQRAEKRAQDEHAKTLAAQHVQHTQPQSQAPAAPAAQTSVMLPPLRLER